MTRVKRTTPLFKALVDAGLIASNQDAKRLIKEGAVTLNTSGRMKDILHYVKITDTIEDLYLAAAHKLWLKIGKKWIEPLSLGDRHDTEQSSHQVSRPEDQSTS